MLPPLTGRYRDMRRFGWIALALTLLTSVAAPAAQAEKRIALLIGNQGYAPEVGRLSNPNNDVALLEGVLKHLGFDVTTVRDAGLAGLHQAVNTHVRRVRQSGPDAVGFFYYSGHGAADGTTNYLIPVDVKTIDDDQLWDQSLRLTEITRKLKDEAGNATHFVVFDACRNTLKLRKTGTKAIVQSKGFVPVSQESGMLIAYATAEGALASDVGTGAGPYATVLADEVVKPAAQPIVPPFLVPDIGANHFLIPPNGRNEVPPRPELVAQKIPQLALHVLRDPD
jgi:uncharacterized caspase-like protein